MFNDNIYKGILGTRYLFNKDYYVKNIKSEFNKLSNNLVNAHSKGINYMMDYINNGENLQKDPLIQKILEINL